MSPGLSMVHRRAFCSSTNVAEKFCSAERSAGSTSAAWNDKNVNGRVLIRLAAVALSHAC